MFVEDGGLNVVAGRPMAILTKLSDHRSTRSEELCGKKKKPEK
jgi:hypothetical protein